ncbi:MAG TPA: TRAP transporter fused permease subunit [Vicinamibacterales bacterium]|nr:TRAP transporter fused permease subunit [Vicinamibacterales bacterium]
MTGPARPEPTIPLEEAPTRRLGGATRRLADLLALGLSLYALYWVLFIVQPQIYRVTFLLGALVLTFLLFPARRGQPGGVTPSDWLLAGASVVALAWPVIDFDRFIYRAADPLAVDVVLGGLTILLVLEATRRTVGWILPATAAAFIAYAYAGPSFDRIGLPLLAHRGYPPDRLVGTLFMTLEGIFGVPLTVAATYIILFTIYGAVLEHSGAGRFFIDWAMAAMGRSRSGAAPGRTVTLAGFLLGTVSGSGVATTVMLGSVSWPLLRGAGYRPETAGAMLSAAGIGALLSPPTLGAAAFLIAEFLRISYLQVLVMATIPTILYYLSIFLMIEADARRLGTRAQRVDVPPLWPLTRRYGYHFTSLAAIAGLMVAGMTAFRAVFWSTIIAVGLSYVRREFRLSPRRLGAALVSGSTGVLGVCATTATAGIIVGIVTLTGLGLKIAGIIVALAGGRLFLTVAYSSVAVWLLGLAVPVTASYIIAAVMVAPALMQAGVPDFAAHMFIFYYAVLSEVSPPTALSPFAAAAITGGNPFRTMMLTWKYALPAFLVPFVFTLTPEGAGVLLRGSPGDAIATTLTAAIGVAALAGGLGGWISGVASPGERVLLVLSGLLLFYAGPRGAAAGVAGLAVVLFLHFRRHRLAAERR